MHMITVSASELCRNLCRYLEQVEEGESIAITERGRKVAHLTPPEAADPSIARLVAERGATMPQANLLSLAAIGGRSAVGPPCQQVLDESRAERL